MPDRIHVLELRSVRGTGGGPEKTILHGAARANRARVAVTVCYIRDARDKVFGIDGRARDLGVDYIEIRERQSFDPAIVPALVRTIRERRIDIVHAHEYKTDLLACVLARMASVIPLATVHGWTGHTWRERRLYYPADKHLLRRFPRVIAVSGEIRGTLVAAGVGVERITTLLNGIDPDVFRRDPGCDAVVRTELGLEPGEIAIGAVGRLELQKRFDVLLDAFARVRRERSTANLFIVGDGSLRQRLAAKATALGLDSACRFLGHRDDIGRLHHAFDLFVQSSDYEGTPNAVLEAMALETPVVATDAGGTRDLLSDGVDGLVVPCGDPDALARAIELTLDDRAETRARVAAARARIERDQSFERRTRRLEAIYEDLMVSTRRRPMVSLAQPSTPKNVTDPIKNAARLN